MTSFHGVARGCALVVLVAGVGASPAAAAPTVSEYSGGLTAGSGPNGIAKGPDGAMWFTQYKADEIGRVSSTGSVSEYPASPPLLSAGADPAAIVTGPDGKLYFSEYQAGGKGAIGELDPGSGQLIGEYPTPTDGSGPDGIAVGADGAIWFAEQSTDGTIGRLDLTTHTITEYSVHVGTHLDYEPTDLVSGPGGSIWITLLGTGQIAQLDIALASPGTDDGFTLYNLPSGASSEPEGITVGPDGSVWAAEYGAGRLARIDPALVQASTSDGITEFPVGGKPLWISNAGDGELWATDNKDNELLRFDLGTDTATVLGAAQGITGDATTDAEDASGNLWVTEFASNKIAEVTFKPANTAPPSITGSATPGQTLNCEAGSWTNQPTSYAYQWLLDGTPIANAINQTYTVPTGDQLHQLSCQVTATNAYGSSAPATSAIMTVAEFVNTGLPAIYEGSIRPTVVVAGDILTCHPGTWSASPTTHVYYWNFNERVFVPGNKKSAGTYQTEGLGGIATGSSIALPDLPAFKNSRDTSTISCIDDANDGSVISSAQSAPVTILPLRPALATKALRTKVGVTRRQVPIQPPAITKGVGAGGVNHCTSGQWSHYPTLYTYTWHREPHTNSKASLLHTGQNFKLSTDQEGLHLVCEVVASNGAGNSRPAFSNTYVVPPSSPRPLTAPAVTISTLNPTTSSYTVGKTNPVIVVNGVTYADEYAAIAERIFMSCDHGTWNRGDLHYSTQWYINGDGADDTPRTSDGGYATVDPIEGAYQHTVTGTDSLRLNFLPGTQQDPSIFNGTVTCMVTATTPQGRDSVSSSVPISIWNGCDIGIEQWESNSTVLNGPLCGDYEAGYAPPGCNVISDLSACFAGDVRWRKRGAPG